jgi:hypothetical protein
MRKLFNLLFLSFLSLVCFSQGKVITQKFLAPSIQNNKGGEDANRRLTIYLPPGYEKTTQR